LSAIVTFLTSILLECATSEIPGLFLQSVRSFVLCSTLNTASRHRCATCPSRNTSVPTPMNLPEVPSRRGVPLVSGAIVRLHGVPINHNAAAISSVHSTSRSVGDRLLPEPCDKIVVFIEFTVQQSTEESNPPHEDEL